jgi:hypothetical protein
VGQDSNPVRFLMRSLSARSIIDGQKRCRVEEWRGSLGRCLCSLLARPFVGGCHIISTMLRFHSPLIKLDGRFSRIQLPDKASHTFAHEPLQLSPLKSAEP